MTIVFSYPGLSVGASDPGAPRFVEHPRITRFEWACQQCGGSGPGMMPEAHASGRCAESSKTDIRPYRMVPEVARAAQHAVVGILYGGTHFMDGGGI